MLRQHKEMKRCYTRRCESRRSPQRAVCVLFLFLSSQMTVFVTGGSAATASSFPAPLPEYTPRQRQSKSNYNHWTENGGGGASSDDEGEDEVGISSEEFEDHNPQGPSNKLLWASQFQPNRAATSNKTILSQVGGRTTPQKAQTATTSPHPEAGSASKQLAPHPHPPKSTAKSLRRIQRKAQKKINLFLCKQLTNCAECWMILTILPVRSLRLYRQFELHWNQYKQRLVALKTLYVYPRQSLHLIPQSP